MTGTDLGLPAAQIDGARVERAPDLAAITGELNALILREQAVERLRARIETARSEAELRELQRLITVERAISSPLAYAVECTKTLGRPVQPYQWARLFNQRLYRLASRQGCRFLIVTVPVRHGKSLLGTTWFPSWYLGHFPDHRVVIGCYNSSFASVFGERVRDIVDLQNPLWFGTRGVSQGRSAKNDWDLARPHQGGLIAVGVGASPTGRGGDLIVIDDPIKNDEEAYSKVYRDKLFRWWQFTLRTRLEPGGVVVLTMSRWHYDDLVGRLIDAQSAGDMLDADGNEIDQWDVLHLPALADPNLIDPDPLGRQPGEALCPERYDRRALLQIRDNPSTGVGEAAFGALYQGVPAPPGGDVFPEDRWSYVTEFPAGMRLIRRWDLAATDDAGDWTAGVLMGFHEGHVYVLDVVRKRTSRPGELIRATAESDIVRWGCTRVRTAQDPGQAGKIQVGDIAATVLAGLSVHYRAQVESGDKFVRAVPWSNLQNVGRAHLLVGPWNRDYVTEHREFPIGKHDDQVDASSAGYAEVAGLLRRKASILA